MTTLELVIVLIVLWIMVMWRVWLEWHALDEEY